jgi:hypothetical protein
MLITNVVRLDADEERNIPERCAVKGAIFDFRGSLLPVEFSAVNSNAMDYFEGLGASAKEPVFTKIWGRQVSGTTTRTVTEESAFGDDVVREIKSTRRDFVITGAAKTPYLWDEADTITAAELTEAMANRETMLAALKQRQEEYKASKGQATAQTAPAQGAFNF